MKQILLKTWLMLCLFLVVGVGNVWAEDVTLTFSEMTGFSGWGTGYSSHNQTYTNIGTLTLNSANKSTSTITDCPVTKGDFVSFVAVDGKEIKSLTFTCKQWTTKAQTITLNTSSDGGKTYTATSIKSSNFTLSASELSSVNAVKFTFSSSSNQVGLVSLAMNIDAVDNRTAVNMSSFTATQTILVRGNTTTTSISNDQSGWTPSYTYESDNTDVATVNSNGVITAVAKGTATITAKLNVANNDANYKKGATSSKTIDITVVNPSHTAHFSINGSVDPANDKMVEEGTNIAFPTQPVFDNTTFVGWSTESIDGKQDDRPSIIDADATQMGNADVTYYAVFAQVDGENEFELAQTLQYDTWTYSGSTTDKSTYRLFHTGSYIESDILDLSKVNKVVVYGGYFGGTSNTSLTIGDGTNVWKDVNVSGNKEGAANTFTNGNSLSGTGKLRITSNSGSNSGSGTGVRISKIEIFTEGFTYSNYCTTLDPQPTINLSAADLSDYVGNTNSTITLGVAENDYAGVLSVKSDKENIATAEIVDGKVAITGVATGTATITVTAPSTATYRKNTATIAVTINNKLAHGLSFDAATLNLTVGDTEITEPTLKNPNSLPVVYSLVYATPANENKVATIDPATGELTLADPSLSTETQGAVTVKATTVGDYSHAAGEVTYNLVVARKVSTTAWSNGGTAVEIDQDEIEALPTASNDAERNLAYESSNTDVATIDGTGAITFVAYGTTTITVKTAATAEYAATQASYTLTFAPHYTVTFNINGHETVLREETSGAGVTAPVAKDIKEYKFAGWKTTTIAAETTETQTFVTLTAGKYMPTESTTLYAVYKRTESSGGEEEDITLSYSSSQSYPSTFTQKTFDGHTFKVKQVGCFDNSSMQFHSADGVIYNDPAFGSSIKQVVVTYKSGSSAKAIAIVLGDNANPTTQAITPSSSGNVYTFDCSSYSYNYLKIYNTSGTNNVISIVITLNAPGTNYYTTTPAAPVDISVSSVGWATYYNAAAYVMPEGLEGRIMKDVDGTIKSVVAYEAGDVVPAETGLLLKNEGNYTLVYSNAAADESKAEGNLLKGNLVEGMTTGGGVGAKYYKLANGGNGLGWYYGDAETQNGSAFQISANKAYLVVEAVEEAAPRFISIFDVPTNITNVTDMSKNSAVYNLNGQRVNNAVKGIVIVNGKKILNK